MPEQWGSPRQEGHSPRGRVAIVGAGVAGCLLATLLGRRGVEVTVYERRPDPRAAGAENGRSINLAISARGLDALARVGLREQVLARALPMHGRMIHPPPTATPPRAGGPPVRLSGGPPLGGAAQRFRPYSADRNRAINSISRAELNHALLDAAESTPGVTLRFGHRLRTLDLASGQLSFESAQGRRRPRADIVLAADGAYSAARQAVTARIGFDYSQDYLTHGYKELTIPPLPPTATPQLSGGPPLATPPEGGPPLPGNGRFALDPDALHIWPRGESMMIALPNLDRSFTVTLFWPKQDLAALDTDAKITAHFADHYPDALTLMPELAEDYRLNPIGSLVTIRAWPWVHRGERSTLALVGDAAHAIVPFFGQGANCALEDCVELDACLTESSGDWQRALASYEQRRKANCDAIADMALENFVEMRDKVNSRVFRARTAAQHVLERCLAGRYVSRYELVSFTTVPYAEIAGRMRRQNRATALAAAAAAAGVLVGAGGLGNAVRNR